MTRHAPSSTSRSHEETVLVRAERLVALERVKRIRAPLERIAAKSPDLSRQHRALRLLIESHLVERRFATVESLCKDLEAATEPEHRTAVEILRGRNEILSGRAREAARRVLPLLKHLNRFEEQRAEAISILALACYRTGHYKWAKDGFLGAVAYYRIAGKPAQCLRNLIGLALVEKSQGRIDVALGHLDDAAALLPPNGLIKSRLRLHLNRGICLLKLGKIDLARVSFMEAQSAASESEDTFLMVSVYNNLGHVYRIRKNYQLAHEFHTRALALAGEADSPRQECLSLEFLGENACEAGHLEEARRYLDEAYESALRIAPRGDLMMEVLRRRGELRARLGESAAARQDLERACALCGVRGEARELLLARRSLLFLTCTSAKDLAHGVRELLPELRSLGDRFEYARTVHQYLSRADSDARSEAWFSAAMDAALHYFSSNGLEEWKSGLRFHAGVKQSASRDSLQVPEAMLSSRSVLFEGTLESIDLAARSDFPVLITGETGSGKEVAARLVHSRSSRSSAPFVAVNCGALPDGLLESEMFGHVRGAYTGAVRDKVGLVESAAGGSLLLDEIGDLSTPMQVKLLRFLDSGEFRRVGDAATRKVDVRIIASTNRDLEQLVSQGGFRSDLLYRLRAFHVEVPPLRERPEDVRTLAEHFVRRLSNSRLEFVLTDELKRWMEGYSWPGNIRELRNLCAYLTAKAWGKTVVDIEDLPPQLQSAPRDCEALTMLDRARVEFERTQLRRALKESAGNISRAAALLHKGRNTVSRRIRELGLDLSDFRD